MCVDCDRLTFNRRKFLSLSAAGIAATSFFVPRRSFAAGAATTSISADEAFAKLKPATRNMSALRSSAPLNF